MPPRPAEDKVLLTGLVERITFHNLENGFCVLRVRARGHRDLVTIVGHAAAVSPGEQIQASGAWVNDRVHGPQFRATSVRAAPPTSLEGIERYLGSGLIKGIGPHFAQKLVAAFGERVFDVIEHERSRLEEIEGIGQVRAQRIAEGWAGQKAIREIMIFLHAHGVSTARAVRIFKTYGADAIAVISDNPYRLARDIRGIGFVTADAIAQKLGIPKDASIRARAGISYALLEALDEGHCGLPRDELVRLAADLLDVAGAVAEQALAEELGGGAVIADTVGDRECIFLAGLYRAEQQIAQRLRRLAQGALPWPAIDADRAIAWAEQKLGMTLAAGQREATALALRTKVLVVTGGPGVGKTTMLRALLSMLRAKRVQMALCAPTGRAAKRLSESTGIEAKTIHRLLEVNPIDGRFRRDEARPIEADLIVVDEMSMVDVPLMHALLKGVPDHAAVLLVGDADQLPPVGPGQVLTDILESRAVPAVRLSEVFRQAAASRIIVNAHRINQGLMPELPGPDDRSDFYFVEAEEPEDGVRKVLQIVTERIPQRFGLQSREVQVLCPMNRGSLGARGLNLELQRALNPPGDVRVERFGWTFSIGDKVMQVENDYDRDVYNGDLGVVSAIDPNANELTIDFDGRPVVYDFGELDRVALAYAITIHKSQGSEYPAVVIPVTTQHYLLLRRNLIYTGVTRGRQLVVLVGQRRALAMAVQGRPSPRRWSKLREWLQA